MTTTDQIIAIEAEITELAEDIEWSGFGTEANVLNQRKADLRAANRRLAQERIIADLPAELTLDRLNHHEAERQHVRAKLADMAREIDTIRGGPVTNDRFRAWQFSSYERYEPDDGEEQHIYVTLTKSARYEPDYHTVSFPESYLDTDWRAIETERVAAEKEAAAEALAATRRAQLTAQEERERAELVRLQEKYGEVS